MHQPVIEIRTRLYNGIYKSLGGGRIVTRDTISPEKGGPIRAAERVHEIHKSNVSSYGNIGCGQTWAVLVDDQGELNVSGYIELLRQDALTRACASPEERRILSPIAKDWTAPQLRAAAKAYNSVCLQEENEQQACEESGQCQ